MRRSTHAYRSVARSRYSIGVIGRLRKYVFDVSHEDRGSQWLKSLASQVNKVYVSMENIIAIDVQTTCRVWVDCIRQQNDEETHAKHRGDP